MTGETAIAAAITATPVLIGLYMADRRRADADARKAERDRKADLVQAEIKTDVNSNMTAALQHIKEGKEELAAARRENKEEIASLRREAAVELKRQTEEAIKAIFEERDRPRRTR